MTAIPEALRDKPRWVIWKNEERGGKITKVLYDPKNPTRRGSSTDPGTWSTYDQAIAIKDQAGAKGIGFVFNGDGIIGVDLDHVRDPVTGVIEPEALQEITALNSYTEVSPSGTGVHVICKGKIPRGRKAGTREMYESGRFFTVTGDHVPGTPDTVNDAQPGITKLYGTWFPEKEKRKAAPAPGTAPTSTGPAPSMTSGSSMDDDQIIALAGEAKNGEKFKNLLVGSIAGYPSQSEAESALCSMLAFYTRDPGQIDRIYRRSGLYRDKWDEQHGSDTYGRITIGNALDLVTEKYSARKDPELSDVAKTICEKLHVVAVGRALFFYEDGIYRYNTGQIEREIQNTLIAAGYSKKIVDAKREIRSYLTGMNWYESPPFNKMEGYIPTRDCVLHITDQGVEELPHDPKYLFSYKLGAKYDPVIDTEGLSEVFKSWVDEEDVKYLIQLPAMMIVQSWGYCFKLAYLFEGPRNAAKTTYFNLLDMFIGEENRCSIPLHSLVANRFASVGLIGRLANVVDELPSVDLRNLDTFKSIVGGGAIRVERKGEDAYTAKPSAVHCFNCNVPPACKISDDDAWWGRWVYARFPNTFAVNPTWKREFLTDTNVSALLNLVLPVVVTIQKTGEVARMDLESVKQIWMESSDTLIKFISDKCIRDPEGVISKDIFYSQFVEFCKDNSKAAPTKTAVTQMLGRHGVCAARPNIDGKQTRSYSGLKWKVEPLAQLTTQKDREISEFAYFSETSKESFLNDISKNKDQNIDDLKDPKEFQKTQQTRMSDTHPVDNSEPEKWYDLIKKYDLPPGLDLSGHQKFTRSGYVCNCKGCGQPGSLWHGDGPTPNSLCDVHYKQLLKAWEDERREGT